MAEEIRISVRGLVEFLYRSGDIDDRRSGASADAMQEGSRIHRMIQKRAGDGYRAEVPLRYEYPLDEYTLVVDGRADGVKDYPGFAVIDEIKGTYRDLSGMQEPVSVHLAQACCYAYIYGSSRHFSSMKVRMTYCNIETEEIRYFDTERSMEELKVWFLGLLEEYRRWSDRQWEWKKKRRESIRGLSFPFPYREGQKELATHVYATIYHRRRLFLEAPTGVGKTLSAVYPSVMAVGQGMGERIFYLTARTITRTAAENAFALLRGKGLHFKTVVLTAKEKICFLEEPVCNPESCPYAKGHFDRINRAMYEMLTEEDSFSRETIEAYAHRYTVCPFELSLDMSLFADGIICDYNYLFDPHVYLKRFFGESAGEGRTGENIFLIDEAHNLLERGREMYSAVLKKEEFLSLHGALAHLTGRSVLAAQGYGKRMEKRLEKCNREMLALKRECDGCCTVSEVDALVQSLLLLREIMEEYLEEMEEGEVAQREEILELYFKVSHFLDMYERVDEHYVIYTRLCEDGSFLVRLFCVDPSANLRACLQKGRSSILFSATLLPIQYYKSLLGGEKEDYEIYARSVFSPAQKEVLIAEDVTSLYSRRTPEAYERIAEYIEEIVKNRKGNYLVFFPSFAFLWSVYDRYQDRFGSQERDCLPQQESMPEKEREAFLARFRSQQTDRTLVGFCVLGGIFAEGIDLEGDCLIGVIIVGTGTPQVCDEREILKAYFGQNPGGEGFDYAYRYPGMNKVLQAAGRLIRTAEDVGIIALLDQRFLQPSYRRLFPREWDNCKTVRIDTVANSVKAFWETKV